MANGIVDPWERIVGPDNDLPEPTSATRCRSASGVKTSESKYICLRYSGRVLLRDAGCRVGESRSLDRIGS